MDFNNFWQSVFNIPYIPPCERNPYYDDPRDVKPETSNPYVNGFFTVGSSYCDPIQKDAIPLVKCSRCGTYFISRGFDCLCEECAKDSQEKQPL